MGSGGRLAAHWGHFLFENLHRYVLGAVFGVVHRWWRAGWRRATIRHVTAVSYEVSLASGYEALGVGKLGGSPRRVPAARWMRLVRPMRSMDSDGRFGGYATARGAVVHRERAYAGFRRDGELARAARIALWLSREQALVFGNEAVASGWLARAERLLRDVAPGAEQGWLSLARSERTRDPNESARLAEEALAVAETAGDTDLELRALAQLGLAEVSVGRVDDGLARLDEAMAAATAGEPTSLETFADVCCTLMLACDLAGDSERPQQWSGVLEDFVRKYDPITLLAFCRTCCADVFAANGRIDAAEGELLAAIRELTDAGQRSRCGHPAARLAEIRVLQGRFDEAEQLLDGFEDEPEAVTAAASLRIARGEPSRGRGASPSETGRGWEVEPARRAALRSARRGISSRRSRRRRACGSGVACPYRRGMRVASVSRRLRCSRAHASGRPRGSRTRSNSFAAQ